MKKSVSLMIPRSVTQKSKNNKGEESCPRVKQDHTTENRQHTSLSRETCPQVLTDVVNVTSVVEGHQLSSDLSSIILPKQSVHSKFAETVSAQKNATYVNVGAISYNKRVPIYSRNRRSLQNPCQSGTRHYNDIAWEPTRNRQPTQHAYNESKYTGHGMNTCYLIYHRCLYCYESLGC